VGERQAADPSDAGEGEYESPPRWGGVRLLFWLCLLVVHQDGEGTATHAILMALGAVIAVAVLGVVGKALVAYFAHFSQCLNGC